MFVSDMFILMLVDVLTSNEIFYFALSTLKLPYSSLKSCMSGEDYTTVVFTLLSDVVKRDNLSLDQIQKKFEHFGIHDTNKLFQDHNGK